MPSAGRGGAVAPVKHAGLLLAVLALNYVFRAEDVGTSALNEDGFYALSVARHLGMGRGMSIDGVHPTTGVQPLWVFVVAPFYALTGGDKLSTLRAVFALQGLIWVALAFACAALARSWARSHGELDGQAAGRWTFVFACLSLQIFFLTYNGLETGLYLLVLALAALRLDRLARDEPPLRRAELFGAGLLLGALCWARLDAVFFSLAWFAIAARASIRARKPSRLLLPPALGLLCILPWLLRNLALGGSLMPSSGSAQQRPFDFAENVVFGIIGLGELTLPVMPVSNLNHPLWVELTIAGIGIAIFLALVTNLVRENRTRRTEMPVSVMAIGIHLVCLVGYYTFNFGAPWFRYRYFSPILLLSLPLFGVIAARFAPRWPRLMRAAPVAILLANVPLIGVIVWNLRLPFVGSATARRGNPFYLHPTRWLLSNVDPACRVGAESSGTIGYFLDNVVNLDGKVNDDYRRFLGAMKVRSPDPNLRLDVVVARTTSPEYTRVTRTGAYHVWVRRGSERCLVSPR